MTSDSGLLNLDYYNEVLSGNFIISLTQKYFSQSFQSVLDRGIKIHPMVWQKCVAQKPDTSPDCTVKSVNFGSSLNIPFGQYHLI